jgi:hypothetical protein
VVRRHAIEAPAAADVQVRVDDTVDDTADLDHLPDAEEGGASEGVLRVPRR